MASINLGGLVKDGNKSRISGMASQFDSSKLIDAAIEAKQIPIKKAEDEVKFSNEKIAAMSEFNTILTTLKEAANKLRSVPGYGMDNEDALNSKKVYLSSGVVENPTSYLEVIASNNVEVGSFDVKIDQIAKSKIQQSRTFTSITTSVTDDSATHTTNRFTAGTFKINNIDIVLEQGDSVAEVISKINAATPLTNVSASIIRPTSTDYRIKLQSVDTGTVNAYTITDASTVLNDVFTHADLDVQTAENSQFKVDGNITVTRSSNSIDDYIEGLTIKLYSPTTGNISVDVDYDKLKAQEAIVDFADKYNKFIDFAAAQQARDKDGKYLDSAKIRRSTALSNSVLDISGQLGNIVANNDGFNYLETIGLGFLGAEISNDYPEARLKLNINAGTLSEAIQNNFDNVKKLFEFQEETDSTYLKVTKRSNNLGSVTAFSVDVDITRAASQRAKITYNATTLDLDFVPTNAADLTKGGFIIGKAGTIFEGFEFQYTGTGDDVIGVTVSQGVMDKLYNTTGTFLDKKYSSSVSGGNDLNIIELEVENINSEITQKLSRIESKKLQLEIKRNSLIEKYARLEAAIAQANSMLQFLEVQQTMMKS